MNRASVGVLVGLALLLAFCARAGSQEGPWFQYEPVEVTLKGRVIEVERFGPPNWGETPKTDMKLRVPLLVLSNPINVRGDPDSDTNVESFSGIKEVQLQGHSDAQKVVDRNVVVKGRLFQAQTGWHFTKVLIHVTEIEIEE